MNKVKKYVDLFRMKNIANGEIYEVEETGKTYVRNGHSWDEMTKTKADGKALTIDLYSLNQNSVMSLSLLGSTELSKKIERLNEWERSKNDNYFMLLSNQFRYYTIFERKKIEQHSFGSQVIDVLKSFAKVYSFDYEETNDTWEIWACLEKDNKVPEVFYLFPYEAGVIYYG